MAIYIWIVDKDGTMTDETYKFQSKFDLMEDRGIYYHLKHLWENVSKETGMKISDDDDGFYEQSNLSTFLNLVNTEIKESEAIQVDEWIFCVDSEIIKTIYGEPYISSKSDSVKVYTAEWFMKSYGYEVIEASKGELKFELKKKFYKVVKSDLVEFLKQIKIKIEKAIELDKRLYLSYS